MIKETIPVTGMMCEHCEHAVISQIQTLPGIKKVKASHKKARVEVQYDETQTTHEAIKAAIVEAGYEPA
ncbi:MAG: cation transporter [Coriobacteriia bacterium]|nr:cation transporter [Coriobacteriia bacterium]